MCVCMCVCVHINIEVNCFLSQLTIFDFVGASAINYDRRNGVERNGTEQSMESIGSTWTFEFLHTDYHLSDKNQDSIEYICFIQIILGLDKKESSMLPIYNLL